ncbi:MAG: sulfite exporter TauE/SafE family protein [Candidatus Tectomicrobia bacterium]|uniref:Probable membrane transporter protein n=1 Tax=Tectimicrobiota bacterium TaxID=2528274 RepID=A0A932LZQ4_UNCTE|nr:sulfite exporter TauE/SafE family protein [Candidatus Tectomicrobia bacterium]
MTAELAGSLAGLGLAGGLLAGLLGIGGGIIMAPLLLYVPPLLHVGAFDMKVVAGLTMVQSLAASLSGVVAHRQFDRVHPNLVLTMGTSSVAASFLGALASRHTEARALLAIFAGMAVVAAVLMILPKKEQSPAPGEELRFCRLLAAGSGLVIGFLGGLVGQSGAFIIVPTLIFVLKIPTRMALGSSLAIVFLSALAGTLGKALGGQIHWEMALFLSAGALGGGWLGGMWSQRVKAPVLRTLLALLIAFAAIRMWWGVFQG